METSTNNQSINEIGSSLRFQPNLQPAKFLRRYKRFLCDAVLADGQRLESYGFYYVDQATAVTGAAAALVVSPDADLNDDGAINFVDLGLLKAVIFTADEDADLNGDGSVNFVDLGMMKQSYFSFGPDLLTDRVTARHADAAVSR